jgi:hypothetical protein
MVGFLKSPSPLRAARSMMPACLATVAAAALVLAGSLGLAQEGTSVAASASSTQGQRPLSFLEQEIDGAFQELRTGTFGTVTKKGSQPERSTLPGEPQRNSSTAREDAEKESLTPRPDVKPAPVPAQKSAMRVSRSEYDTLARNHDRLQKSFQRLSQQYRDLIKRSETLKGRVEELVRHNQLLRENMTQLKAVSEELRENHRKQRLQVSSEVTPPRGSAVSVPLPRVRENRQQSNGVPWTPPTVFDDVNESAVVGLAAKFPPDFTN